MAAAQATASGAAPEAQEQAPPLPKKEKASKTPKPPRAKKATPGEAENFAVIIQVRAFGRLAGGGSAASILPWPSRSPLSSWHSSGVSSRTPT